MAATPIPISAPAHTPTARRSHSRRHSRHPVSGRLVERRAATTPRNIHTIALVTMATSQRRAPPITGIPVSGRVGNDMIANTNPGMPRHAESDPVRRTAATSPVATGIMSAARAAFLRTMRRWKRGPSGTASVRAEPFSTDPR